MARLKAAVIGAGHIAQQHLRGLRRLPDVDVVGVCDLSPALAEASAERHRLPAWFTDHRRMLADTRPDVVHVTTPAPTHFRLALEALEAGGHVLVEKPITTSLDELTTLADAAAARRRVLVEDHNYLFNETARRALGLATSGALGEVVHVEVGIALDLRAKGSRYSDRNLPHPSLKLPGGAVGDFLTHLAYLAYAFIGPERRVQTSWVQSPGSPVPHDEFRALVDGTRGTGLLLFSGRAQPDAFWLRVLGTRMRVEAHLWEPRLAVERLYTKVKPLMPLRIGVTRARDEWNSGFRSIARKLDGGAGSYEGLWELLRATYAALAQGKPPPLSIQHIMDVNRLVHTLTQECAA